MYISLNHYAFKVSNFSLAAQNKAVDFSSFETSLSFEMLENR